MNDESIGRIYKPQEGRSTYDWSAGLTVVKADRLEEYLTKTTTATTTTATGKKDTNSNGDDDDGNNTTTPNSNAVLVSIRTAGEHLQRARQIVRELEEEEEQNNNNNNNSNDAEDIGSEKRMKYEALCEAISSYALMPTMRFYNSILVMKETVSRATQAVAPAISFSQPASWTDAQYHAIVTYLLSMQVVGGAMPSRGANDEALTHELIRAFEAAIEARPDDPRILVMYGNWLMIQSFTQDAVEQLEKAVQLNPIRCFGSFYTIANICQNSVNMEKLQGEDTINNMLARIGAKAATEKCVHCLERYLELAPFGHWHVHRACMTLILLKGRLLARGTEHISSIAMRNPDFAPNALTVFERGVRAFHLYENCYGDEQSDFRNIYKQASSMISTMRSEGLLPTVTNASAAGLGKSNTSEMSDYMCSYPPCSKEAEWGTKLKKCSRCVSAQYCSKECQVLHWKSGHKKQCPKLAAARQERKEAMPQKWKRISVDAPQFGDK